MDKKFWGGQMMKNLTTVKMNHSYVKPCETKPYVVSPCETKPYAV